jgi:hypothetical protein
MEINGKKKSRMPSHLKNCSGMRNLRIGYWKSIDTSFIQSAEISDGADVLTRQLDYQCFRPKVVNTTKLKHLTTNDLIFRADLWVP